MWVLAELSNRGQGQFKVDEVRRQGWPHHGSAERVGMAVSKRCYEVLAGGDGELAQPRGHRRLSREVGGAM